MGVCIFMDAIDLGRDRGRLSPAPPHDHALGWAAVMSGSMAPGLPLAMRQNSSP
jgi:hypothetical protein